jgi:hypothetical protein
MIGAIVARVDARGPQEAADSQALSTRQSIAMPALSLTNRSQQSVLLLRLALLRRQQSMRRGISPRFSLQMTKRTLLPGSGHIDNRR